MMMNFCTTSCCNFCSTKCIDWIKKQANKAVITCTESNTTTTIGSSTKTKTKYRRLSGSSSPGEDTVGAKEYGVMRHMDMILQQYETIPMEKVFTLQQPHHSPLSTHPQFNTSNEEESKITSPIHQQPKLATTSSRDTRTSTATSRRVCDRHHDDKPNIHFSLYYDFQRSTLAVRLISGFNMPTVRKGVSITAFLIPNKEQIFESHTSTGGMNPIFEETFEIAGISSEEVRRQSLVFRVTNKNTTQEIGTVIQNLNEADLYGIEMQARLSQDKSILNNSKSDRSNGDILISLTYDPFAKTIYGVLLKATNLKKMDIRGLTDPYVKIYFCHKGERVCKWKSSIKKGTLVPIYNENFQFHLNRMDISAVALEVNVVDHDVLGSNDLIGSFDISKDSAHKTGSEQWVNMTSSPRSQTCYWHSIPKPQGSLMKSFGQVRYMSLDRMAGGQSYQSKKKGNQPTRTKQNNTLR